MTRSYVETLRKTSFCQKDAPSALGISACAEFVVACVQTIGDDENKQMKG
jgi:hypothetical protein